MTLFDEIHLAYDRRLQDATIIRTTGNVATKMIGEETGIDTGRRRIDPLLDFEVFAKMPAESGVVMGDLILSNDVYYLVMALEPKMYMGTPGFYKASLYECNSIVTIYAYGDVSKKLDTSFKADVRCLITTSRNLRDVPDDKAVINRRFRGSSAPFFLYMRSSEGLLSDGSHMVVDQDSRRFRLYKQFDYFIANGILRAGVTWENR
jgi:hypothetical protein